MDEIVVVSDFIVLACTAYLLLINLKHLLWSSRTVYFLVFFALYVFPVFLDYLAGFQEHYHWGYYVASRDSTTRVIYDILLIIVMCSLTFINNRGLIDSFRDSFSKQNIRLNSKYSSLIYFFIVFPTIAVLLLMRNPEILYTFQWREFELFSDGGSYSTIERFVYFGIVCSVVILFDNKSSFWNIRRLFALLFLYINVCIQGKRAILFFAIIAILLVVVFQYITLRIQKKSTFLFTVVFMSLISIGAAYMIWSSIEVKIGRGYSETAEDMLYTSTRIDMFREDRIKMAIYSEQHPNKIKILDYKGQSLITDIVSIIPFNYISEPMGLSQGTYQVHFSMAMFGEKYNNNNPKANRNYMTCTIWAELISNFGIVIGSVFFIMLTLWFIKLTDKYPYPYNIFIITTYSLLNLFDFTYIVLFIELTWLFCYKYRKSTYNKAIVKS